MRPYSEDVKADVRPTALSADSNCCKINLTFHPKPSMDSLRPCRVRVVVPHFYREGKQPIGHGSSRTGTRLARQLALGRCLCALLALGRQAQDLILNPAEEMFEITPPIRDNSTRLTGVQVELHVFVSGSHYLEELISQLSDRLTVHHLDLGNSLELPLAASQWLCCHSEPADLHLYFEDDLVIQDPRYVDKLVWFTERTQHRYVLMPHRLEPCVAQAPMRLYVDGPGKPVGQEKPVWSDQEQEQARGTYWDGRSVGFAEASNPHSGSFCLSESQRQLLLTSGAEPVDFVGPLETAATGTVLAKFPVWKTVWAERDFLWVEHGHPSFLEHLHRLPVRALQ